VLHRDFDLAVIQDVSQLRRYQEDLEQSRARLQQLIAHRESVVDEVHKKIAVEIHDQLGQIITAALLHVRLLDRSLPATDAAARELVRNIDGLLNDAYRSMKDIAVSLRPAVLNFGFVAAAEWLAERVLGVAGIAWRITTSEPPPSLDERQSIAFFRIIQESLTNCVRHAGASEVTVSLATDGDRLVLEIADNGRGLTVAAAEQETRFGLLGIRERAESLGGTASIVGAPAGGTRVRVVVPAGA
jgi:signal transduction histidine kinase